MKTKAELVVIVQEVRRSGVDWRIVPSKFLSGMYCLCLAGHEEWIDFPVWYGTKEEFMVAINES